MVWIPPRSNGEQSAAAAEGKVRGPSVRGASDRSHASGGEAQNCGCTDGAARAQLVPYVLSRLDEDACEDFELHILACERCFQDLRILDHAGRLLQEHRRRVEGDSNLRDLGLSARDR